MTKPPAHLLKARSNLDALKADLERLEAAISERDATLTAARRAHKTPDELARVGTEAAVLKSVLRDQEADVKHAAAEVARIEREVEVDRLRGEHAATLKTLDDAEATMTGAFALAYDHVLAQVARINEARRRRTAALRQLRIVGAQIGEPTDRPERFELAPRFTSQRHIPRPLESLPAAIAHVDEEVRVAHNRVRGDMRVPNAIKAALAEATTNIEEKQQ
jgi:hypothetical protein